MPGLCSSKIQTVNRATANNDLSKYSPNAGPPLAVLTPPPPFRLSPPSPHCNDPLKYTDPF